MSGRITGHNYLIQLLFDASQLLQGQFDQIDLLLWTGHGDEWSASEERMKAGARVTRRVSGTDL